MNDGRVSSFHEYAIFFSFSFLFFRKNAFFSYIKPLLVNIITLLQNTSLSTHPQVFDRKDNRKLDEKLNDFFSAFDFSFLPRFSKALSPSFSHSRISTKTFSFPLPSSLSSPLPLFSVSSRTLSIFHTSPSTVTIRSRVTPLLTPRQ